MSEAHMTAVLGGFGATHPEAVSGIVCRLYPNNQLSHHDCGASHLHPAAQLKACEDAGLMCIPSSCESLNSPASTCVSMRNPSLIGFQMFDEPLPSQFPALSNWSKSVASRAPNALRFINLLPPTPQIVPYEKYVGSFIDQVNPNILSFDM